MIFQKLIKTSEKHTKFNKVSPMSAQIIGGILFCIICRFTIAHFV